jgi:hypothetical protein
MDGAGLASAPPAVPICSGILTLIETDLDNHLSSMRRERWGLNRSAQLRCSSSAKPPHTLRLPWAGPLDWHGSQTAADCRPLFA